MSKVVAILILLLLVAAIIGGAFFVVGVGAKNQLVKLDEEINGQWAQVETVLQRRYDLIPNLVSTVKGYAQHESGVLEEITRLRSQWGTSRRPEEGVPAAAGLESALARLLMVTERYPDLKANANFLALQAELTATEDRIATARGHYNDAVRSYNTAVRSFPNSAFASRFGFARREVYFEAAPQAAAAPAVQF